MQRIRRAVASGRATDDGLIVIEGPHLVEESLQGDWQIEHVVVTPRARERFGDLLARINCECIEAPARTFTGLADTETSQEMLALVKPREYGWRDLLGKNAPLVVLDGIQDPGNAGTIIRSAEAFGAAGVILLEGSVRVANGKFLRATAGSIFRIPYLEGIQRSRLGGEMGKIGMKVYALMASGALPLDRANLRGSCCIVAGSEANGISPEVRAMAESISIATQQVESLNAAVACSIALFEAARQRGRG